MLNIKLLWSWKFYGKIIQIVSSESFSESFLLMQKEKLEKLIQTWIKSFKTELKSLMNDTRFVDEVPRGFLCFCLIHVFVACLRCIKFHKHIKQSFKKSQTLPKTKLMEPQQEEIKHLFALKGVNY